jgi:hypothetical protein
MLNNREWALVIWFLAFIIFASFSKKMDKVRESFKHLFKAFFVKAIASIFILMLIYIIAVVFALFKIGLWESHQLKNTIIWATSVGALSLFRINSIKEDGQFFKNAVLDNLKLIAIVQFVVGFYTFGLFVEILIVPVLIILGAMLALAKTDKKYHLVEKILNGIMVTFGSILILYTIYMLVTHFGEFAKKQTIYDFYIPPLLTLLYLPFIFIMMVFTTYEVVFVRLKFLIKDPKLQPFAKIYSIYKFHIRIKLLERWTNTLPLQDTSSKTGIKESINRIFKMLSIERNPPEVPIQEGWSPYAAKRFLLNEGLETGYYHPLGDQKWGASTNLIDLDDGVLSNKIAYYVDGNETTANSLKVILSIFSKESAVMAHSKLLSSVKTLLRAALGIDTSSDIESAIMKGKNYVKSLDSFIATIKKNDWPNSPVGGYDLEFTLSRI